MAEKRIGMTLRLGKALWDRLETEHKRTGAPKTTIVTRALDAYLPKQRRSKRGA